MSQIFLQSSISLDGYTEDRNCDISWMTDDTCFDDMATQTLRSIDGMIFGRKAHALLAEFWPGAGDSKEASPALKEQAKLMNAPPKYVLTHGDEKTGWANSHTVSLDDIAKLKSEAKRPIALFAGAKAAQSVLECGVIDEIRLIQCPVMLGGGTLLFKEQTDPQALSLLESRTFESGAVFGGINWKHRRSNMAGLTKVVPSLWFAKEAEEAAEFYTSIFPDSGIVRVTDLPTDSPIGPAGSVKLVDFMIFGQSFTALKSGPLDEFNHAISFSVMCDSQDEINTYYAALLKGGSEEQCGCVKDKFGVSWKIVPRGLADMIAGSNRTRAKRVADAMLQMKKIAIGALEVMALDKTERRLQIGVLGYRFPRSRSCIVPAADPRKPSLNSMFEFH